MGAWAYCHRCHAGFYKPTIVEALRGFQECECGDTRVLDAIDRETAAEEIVERIETLETSLSKLETQLMKAGIVPEP